MKQSFREIFAKLQKSGVEIVRESEIVRHGIGVLHLMHYRADFDPLPGDARQSLSLARGVSWHENNAQLWGLLIIDDVKANPELTIEEGVPPYDTWLLVFSAKPKVTLSPNLQENLLTNLAALSNGQLLDQMIELIDTVSRAPALLERTRDAEGVEHLRRRRPWPLPSKFPSDAD